MKKLAIMLLTGAMSLGLASCANSTITSSSPSSSNQNNSEKKSLYRKYIFPAARHPRLYIFLVARRYGHRLKQQNFLCRQAIME